MGCEREGEGMRDIGGGEWEGGFDNYFISYEAE